MKLVKENVRYFVENIEKLKPYDGPAYLEFQVENTFFTGQRKTARVCLKHNEGQWYYSVSQPPVITANLEKITAEETATIIEKYLPSVNEALGELPWALVK